MAKLGGGEAKVTKWLNFRKRFPGDDIGKAVGASVSCLATYRM